MALYQYFERGFQYIFQHWDRVGPRFYEHLQIIGITLLIALVIALPLGLLINRVRWLTPPVLGILNIFYTIPSLAFLALLVPIFGLGSLTTIIVLIVYAQTMLVRNTALGFNGIDPSILEAARGMGMSSMQTFWKVELPLAIPVIVAGMRIATLAIVSIATIGALVGAGGLGQLILTQPDNYRLNAAAIILIVFIALSADQLYRFIERASGDYRFRNPRSGRRVNALNTTLKDAQEMVKV